MYQTAYKGEILLLYADDMLIEFANQKALETWELSRHDTWNEFGMVINAAKSKIMTSAPIENRRGRPRATEVIAKTNHKVDQFFLKKTA